MFTDRDYVVTSKETGSVSHALLPPSGEIILELLRYIWSLWEDPVDVSYNCNSHVIVLLMLCIWSDPAGNKTPMQRNVWKYHQDSPAVWFRYWFWTFPIVSHWFSSVLHHLVAKNEHLLALAKLLLSLESPTRGKFILLSSLSQHLAVGELVSTFPHLPGDLLSVMGHQSLACHVSASSDWWVRQEWPLTLSIAQAGELWSRLVQVHWKEVHESEEAEAIWNEVMCFPSNFRMWQTSMNEIFLWITSEGKDNVLFPPSLISADVGISCAESDACFRSIGQETCSASEWPIHCQ